MPFKLTNLPPGLSRLGKSANMEKGQTSNANANASRQGKGKAAAQGSGSSSPASSKSSRSEKFLSSSSDSGRDIAGRFRSPEEYIAHQNAKAKIRGKHAEKALSEIKKEVKASDARLKKELAKIDQEEAKAVKEKATADKLDKKAERRLKKEIAKERSFVLKEQVKAAKEQRNLESKLNKEGKLSLRQQAQKEIDAKQAYERDLNAALAESALEDASARTTDIIHEHARGYFPSPENSPRAHDASGEPHHTLASLLAVPQESSDHPVRSLEHPVGKGLFDHLNEKLDTFPGGAHAELFQPSKIAVPPARKPGETTREMIERVKAEVDFEAAYGTGSNPNSPGSQGGTGRSNESSKSTGLDRLSRESPGTFPDEIGNASRGNADIPESSRARAGSPHSSAGSNTSGGLRKIESNLNRELGEIDAEIGKIREERAGIVRQAMSKDGVPVNLRTTAADIQERMRIEEATSPFASTNPSSPLTPSSQPSSATTYTSSQFERDMAEIHVEQQKVQNQTAAFRGKFEDIKPISLDGPPKRPAGAPSNPSKVPKSEVERAKAAIAAEGERIERLEAMRTARQNRSREAWAAADARQAEAFARQAAEKRNPNRAGQETPGETSASNQTRTGINPAHGRTPSSLSIPPNIVSDRVSALEESIRSERSGSEIAAGPNVARSLQRAAEPISPDVINRPFGNWNETAGANPPGRQPADTHAGRVAWAWDALPSALAANSSVPPMRPPVSPASSVRGSGSSSGSESASLPPTPGASQPDTTLAERMAWAREALAANPHLGSRNPPPPLQVPERERRTMADMLKEPMSPTTPPAPPEN